MTEKKNPREKVKQRKRKTSIVEEPVSQTDLTLKSSCMGASLV